MQGKGPRKEENGAKEVEEKKKKNKKKEKKKEKRKRSKERYDQEKWGRDNRKTEMGKKVSDRWHKR